ncbi:cobalamin B12-binding domain-containing protein [bacterium]|nr:cobalamin B12-binding domain-containing protein [bacterium]
MARLFLMSCNLTREPYPVYPLGMSMVAGAARRHGHDVREWDLLAQGRDLEAAAAEIEVYRPDVIGLSLRNVDNIDSVSSISYTDHYCQIVRFLKERFKVPVVIGGAAASLFPEELLAATGADYAVQGEGERTFCRLVEEIEQGSLPDLRVWHGLELLEEDSFQSKGRDADTARYYMREGGMLNIQTKRGCPHRCAYCTYYLLEGCRYRFRSPKEVVEEIVRLRDQYSMDYLAITDSTFNDAEGHYLEVAEEMLRRQVQVNWMAFLRPQRFTEEEATLLKRAGLASIEWGSDCATDVTLAGMQKGFGWSEVEWSNQIFARLEIPNAHFIIFGGPNETEETVKEGLANLERLERCVVFAFRGVRILPGTAVHRRALKEEIIQPGQDLLQPVFYYSPGVDPDFIHRTILESFNGREDRIYPPAQDVDRIQAFHRMGYRGPVWDLLLSKKGRRPAFKG